MKQYKHICKYKPCSKHFTNRFEDQKYCSQRCSGIDSIKKRVYKKIQKNTSKSKDDSLHYNSDRKPSTYCEPIENRQGKDTRYKPIQYPNTEIELYDCIYNNDIISRPAMVKIIKNSKAYKHYISSEM